MVAVYRSTVPDKKVGTQSKFSPPPTYNVQNQVIFSFLLEKNMTFSNTDLGGWGRNDTAQVSQLLLAGIVDCNAKPKIYPLRNQRVHGL